MSKKRPHMPDREPKPSVVQWSVLPIEKGSLGSLGALMEQDDARAAMFDLRTFSDRKVDEMLSSDLPPDKLIRLLRLAMSIIRSQDKALMDHEKRMIAANRSNPETVGWFEFMMGQSTALQQARERLASTLDLATDSGDLAHRQSQTIVGLKVENADLTKKLEAAAVRIRALQIALQTKK